MHNNCSLLENLEIQELVQKLKKNGYEDLVEILLNNENECYTKKGRMNKSGACRKGGWKAKELEDMLLGAKELLKQEIDE